MGTTTNRGLRYPEGVALGNTMHTQIKNLADDVDAKFQFPNVRYQMRTNGEVTPNNAVYTLIYWVPVETSPRITWNGTSTFTILDAGLYTFTFQAMFRNEYSSAGMRSSHIVVNGTQVCGAYAAPVPGQAEYVSSTNAVSLRVSANSPVQFRTLQTSGGAVTVHDGPWTNMSIARVN